MILFRSCPRCKGELHGETDPETGAYYHCIQCGHNIFLPVPPQRILPKAA